MKIFYCLCFSLLFGCLYSQRVVKLKSERLLKRDAFNQLDHFFIGGDVGLNILFFHQDQIVNHEITNSYLALDPTPDVPKPLPSLRIFGGYKYKRHCFQVGLETVQYHQSFIKYSFFTYINSFFTSITYNIDLFYKVPQFKVYTGAQLGFITIPMSNPNVVYVIPGAGFNIMMELPITRTTSFYWDTRFILGLAPIVRNWNYSEANDGNYRRIFTVNATIGIKFSLFSKKNTAIGMGN